MPTLRYSIAMGHSIEVLRIMSNIYDPKVTKFFTYRDHIVTLCSQIKKIYQPFFVVVFATTFFSIRIWNFLPLDVVEAGSLNILNDPVDEHW